MGSLAILVSKIPQRRYKPARLIAHTLSTACNDAPWSNRACTRIATFPLESLPTATCRGVSPFCPPSEPHTKHKQEHERQTLLTACKRIGPLGDFRIASTACKLPALACAWRGVFPSCSFEIWITGTNSPVLYNLINSFRISSSLQQKLQNLSWWVCMQRRLSLVVQSIDVCLASLHQQYGCYHWLHIMQCTVSHLRMHTQVPHVKETQQIQGLFQPSQCCRCLLLFPQTELPIVQTFQPPTARHPERSRHPWHRFWK